MEPYRRVYFRQGAHNEPLMCVQVAYDAQHFNSFHPYLHAEQLHGDIVVKDVCFMTIGQVAYREMSI